MIVSCDRTAFFVAFAVNLISFDHFFPVFSSFCGWIIFAFQFTMSSHTPSCSVIQYYSIQCGEIRNGIRPTYIQSDIHLANLQWPSPSWHVLVSRCRPGGNCPRVSHYYPTLTEQGNIRSTRMQLSHKPLHPLTPLLLCSFAPPCPHMPH